MDKFKGEHTNKKVLRGLGGMDSWLIDVLETGEEGYADMNTRYSKEEMKLFSGC